MATRIQLRRDTAANFTSANPTLAAGELAYETDTRKIKAGDGSTAWTSLNYIVDPSQAAAISDIHADLSPELGGSLNANNLNISSANQISGNNITANTFTGSGAGNVLGFAGGKLQVDGVDILPSTALATVATTGAYADVTGTPSLASVATSGSYNDLSGKPSLSTVATSGAYGDLSGTPSLATVATSGAYSDLSGTPSATTKADLDVDHLITLSGVAAASDDLGTFTGSTIADARKVKGALQDLETSVETKAATSSLSTVATSGSYSDLSNQPTSFADLTITGNLVVQGTKTELSTATLEVEDKNITLAKDSASAAASNGAGITVDGASATLIYNDNPEKWVFNKAPFHNANRLLTTADEGTGNGLDADTLDGQEGSHYLDYGNFTNTPTIPTAASLDVDHLITLSGVSSASDHLGTFTGSTIQDNVTVKAAIQALETAVELAEETSAINSVYTGALGLSAGDAHFGTFTGSTISDNQDAKEALQALETAVETKLDASSIPTKASLDVDHLITLTGVAAASDDLGTFSGSTITDNSTLKTALQELETAVEAAEETQAEFHVDHLITLSGVVQASDHLGTFSGSTISDNRTVKQALQDLETAVEAAEETSAINTVYTGALGLSAGDAHFGTFSGSTISDDRDAKEALQELETAVETKLDASAVPTKASLDVDHLITLSGVAAASDNLGTFTGSTISDNQTLKAALQALETSVETKAGKAVDETITGNYTFNELISGVGIKSSSNDSKMTLSATTNEGGSNIVISAGENIHFLSDRNANDGDGSICFHFNDSHDTSIAVADSFWKMDETGRFGGKDATSHVEFPSWTSTERDNGSFGAGAVIFNSTTSKLQVYDGSNWVDLH